MIALANHPFSGKVQTCAERETDHMPEPDEAGPAGPGHNLPPPEDKTPAEKLADVAAQVLVLQDESAQLANRDKIIGTQIRDLQQKVIPDLMAQLGAKAWEGEGVRVAMSTKVKGAISSAPDVEKAFSLLRQLDFPGAIATTMTVSFGPGEEDLATKIAELLGETFNREVSLERTVHSSTLQAFGREKLADGTPIDLGMLGLFASVEATVKRK
jgi:hypothetical protein